MGRQLLCAALVLLGFCVSGVWGADGGKRPNIVLILADDLGVGEVGCYGQTIIRTPNMDRMAAEGMRFTDAYAPAPLCSPTRCSILTGLHQGHAAIRQNVELQPEGQMPLPAGTVTVAEMLKQGGYATACIGKWGLGPVGSTGDPLKMGFDYFWGHNCQRVAHNHYTDHVWKNDERVELAGNGVSEERPASGAAKRGGEYVPDMMMEEAVEWMKEHRDGPFFLYFTTPLPHASLQAPEEEVAKYRGVVTEGKKYEKTGDYLECDEPRATYAAMVSRLDEHVGKILEAIKEMGIEGNTIVIFTSDNGPQVFGGTDSAYFHSTGGLRGLKHDLYEGGIREPMIVRWPGHVKAGVVSGFATVQYDFMATFLDLAGLPAAGRTDGVSIVPTIMGTGEQKEHAYLYWEHAAKGGQKAVRMGKWKADWMGLKKNPQKAGELYDLEKDPDETTDVSKENPEIMKEMTKFRDESHEKASVKGWNY